LPNWTLNRLNVIGPEFEVMRFVQSCIRIPDGSDEVSFDFEALRPMPEIIRATAEDPSPEAKERARQETGYDDVRHWALVNWATKWNSCSFMELVSEPNRYSCRFDTAWSYPEPIFRELAVRFPLLTVRVFSISEGCGAGVVADIRGGHYTDASLPVSRKLRKLAYDRETEAGFPDVCSLPEHLQHMLNLGLESMIAGIKDMESAAQVVERAWAAAYTHFNDEERARIAFVEDASGYLEWLEISYDSDERPTWDEAKEALGSDVESETNLRYLYEQIRCAVDMSLIEAVSERIDPRVAATAATASTLAGPWQNNDEDELLEWVPFAVARGWKVDLSDLEALHECAAAAAVALEQAVMNNIRSSGSTDYGNQELKAA
jgi:hypothetical protein